MNSEELELSLRAEFESYLKTVLAEMRQETTEFQSKIEAEFDKQKASIDEAFTAFAARFDLSPRFDEAFTGSVTEHLRLARDEGAKITANAIAEAEKMGEATAAPANYDGIRDAVDDISSKDSQSAILKSLVSHAEQFAPRGAFFIIKNEHFVGWKVFGTDDPAADAAVREIHFPMAADTILGSSVASRSTAEASAGAHSHDASFLDPLQFGQPDRMYAIPLVARGRGVAVLYADYGQGGSVLNREALETLVRVAGLTVELLAASQTAKAENRDVAAADFEDTQHEGESDDSQAAEPGFDATSSEGPSAAFPPAEAATPGFAFSESVSFEGGFPQEVEAARPFDSEPAAEPTPVSHMAEEPQHDDSASFEAEETRVGAPPQTDAGDDAMMFESGGSIEPAAFSSSPFDQAAAEFEPAAAVSGTGFNQVVEPAVEAPSVAVPQARVSDRPVDLPIEVPDEERRIHNDARRFARLLVSEIKLYNEKKVIEGREAQDLYERLREAIDRSRDMYDKRVQPPVAAKFDYFHYELVNSLAEGDSQRLGASYPGSTV